MTRDREIDYEHVPSDMPMDETDVSLRAYLAGLSDEHLAAYDRSWTDEQVREWDGNFRSDGALMLVCCERDVDVREFREVLEEHLAYRGVPSLARRAQPDRTTGPKSG
jgi:hypothetical protein